MGSDRLNVTQAVSLLCVFLCGNLTVTYGEMLSGGYAPLCFLAAALGGVLPMALYAYILKFRQTGNIYDTVAVLFKKPFFIAFSIILILLAVVYGCLSLKMFTQMIGATALPNTPALLLSFCVCFVSAIMVKSGINVAGKCAFVFLIFVCATLIITSLLTMSDIDFKNLYDVFRFNGFIYDFIYFFCGTFCKTIIFIGAASHIVGTKPVNKVIILGGALAVAIVTITMLRDILTLGSNVCAMLSFPSYYAVSAIKLFDFIQRIEVISTVNMLFCCIIEVAVCIYCVCIGISRLSKVPCAKNVALPVGLCLAGVSASLNIVDIKSVFFWFSICFAVFSVGLALIIALKIKNSDKKSVISKN